MGWTGFLQLQNCSKQGFWCPSQHLRVFGNALRQRVGLLGCAGQGQELEWMIPVTPFWLWIFHDSIISLICWELISFIKCSTPFLKATAPKWGLFISLILGPEGKHSYTTFFSEHLIEYGPQWRCKRPQISTDLLLSVTHFSSISLEPFLFLLGIAWIGKF